MNKTTALIQLQEADKTMLVIRQKLEELPQRKALEDNARKRKAVEDKSEQIQTLIASYEQQVEQLQQEDSDLADAVAKSRKTIDETHDYRLIASITRDMEGSMKRRDNIEFELGQLAERIDKAQALAQVAADKLEEADDRARELKAEFDEAAADGQKVIDNAQAQRDEAAAALDAETLATYEELRARKGGFGAAELQDGHCSVCRIEFPEGQLSRLLDGPAISRCPNCHRLIVVREEE